MGCAAVGTRGSAEEGMAGWASGAPEILKQAGLASWCFGEQVSSLACMRAQSFYDPQFFVTCRSVLAQGAENTRVCGLQAWRNQGASAVFHPFSSLDGHHSKAGFSQH